MLATDELADFVQGAPQFVHFAAQLIHFVVPVATVVAAVALVVLTAVVVAMGPPCHFLGQVVETGGAEVFDGDH